MKVFVVVGESFETFGVFESLESAQKRIRDIHGNGYFGSLQVSEDESFVEEL